MKTKTIEVKTGLTFTDENRVEWTVEKRVHTDFWTCREDENDTTCKWHADDIRANIFPDTYLHVVECRSGQEWIEPIGPRALLDLTTRVKAWIKKEFSGELRMDGKIMPRLEGDFFAQIKTDGARPESVTCWESGGFYLANP